MKKKVFLIVAGLAVAVLVSFLVKRSGDKTPQKATALIHEKAKIAEKLEEGEKKNPSSNPNRPMERTIVYNKETISALRKQPEENPANIECEGMIIDILRDQSNIEQGSDKTFSWNAACNESPEYKDTAYRVIGFCKSKTDLISNQDCLRQIGELKAKMVAQITKDYNPEDFTNSELLKNRISGMVITENRPYSEVGPYVDRALDIAGDDPEILKMALLTKGLAVIKKEHTPSEAETEKLEKLVQRSLDQKVVTTPDAFEIYAASLLLSGQFDKALEAANKYEPYFPNSGVSNYLRAAVYNRTSQRSEAIAQVETAIAKEPSSQRYKDTLAKLSAASKEQTVTDAFKFNFSLSYNQTTPDELK